MTEMTSRLLDHYRSHVCQLMMPTSAPAHNPYLRLYLPMALQKPSNLVKEWLLFGILSVAAFNQAQLSPENRSLYRNKASEYKDKAAHLLKACVAKAQEDVSAIVDSATDKQALLAAAITMTTIGVCPPRASFSCRKCHN